MTSAPPEVSVVIPTRDRAELVRDAVACALAQEDVALEVLVVDDGSKDETPERLRAVEDARLEVMRHESSRGVAHARNDAAARARGRWLAFLDDDDLWAPRWLRTAIDAGEAAGAGLVYGGFLVIGPDRSVIEAHLPVRRDLLLQRLSRDNALGGPSCAVIRGDVFREAGDFDPSFHALADWDLWLRLLRATSPVAVPELLVAWTRHQGNMHVRDPMSVFSEHERLMPSDAAAHAEFARWLARENVLYGDGRNAARFYLEAARRSLRPGDLVRAALVTRRSARARSAPPAVRESPRWLSAWEPAAPGSR